MASRDMLARFREAKAPEMAALREMEAKGTIPKALNGLRRDFVGALRNNNRIAVIAEYKRASPSKGVINLGLEPEDVARLYAGAGAAALSVLTEERHFQGSLDFLQRMTAAGLPLLRKDFIHDPLQVRMTAATPAAAILLIVRYLDSVMELADLLDICGTYGLAAVVEVFDETDLDKARVAGATIIQVNNRNLDTLTVDLAVSERLVPWRRAEETWISASGIAAHQDLVRLRELGFDAALVGSSLMAAADPGQALARLILGNNDRDNGGNDNGNDEGHAPRNHGDAA